MHNAYLCSRTSLLWLDDKLSDFSLVAGFMIDMLVGASCVPVTIDR